MKKDYKKHKMPEENSVENFEEENFAEKNVLDEHAEAQNMIETLQEERDKLKDDFLRALADMENLKKRCAAEIEKNNKYAISSFAKDLLGVADNLQRAIDAAQNGAQNASGLLEGIKLTQNELTKVFEKFGIKKMDAMNTVFNPNFHRVVQEVEDNEKENGTIVAELQTGYMIGDRILREAMVVVTKKPQIEL